jgi:hypothetical protein
VGHRATAVSLHRQPRLGAVERLDLRFLIHRECQCMLGRIDVEPDESRTLAAKFGSFDSLKLRIRRGFRPCERPRP